MWAKYREFDILAQYKLVVHPEADREYDGFVNADRSTAYDVGNHFRVLEAIVNDGVAEGIRPTYMDDGKDLYMFYGNALQMFVAVHEQTVLLVHLSAMGKEYEEAQALACAIRRLTEYLG